MTPFKLACWPTIILDLARTKSVMKIYSQDEGKDVHLATGIFGFWQGKKAENVVCFISDVGIHRIICLRLYTIKFKKLDYLSSLCIFLI